MGQATVSCVEETLLNVITDGSISVTGISHHLVGFNNL